MLEWCLKCSCFSYRPICQALNQCRRPYPKQMHIDLQLWCPRTQWAFLTMTICNSLLYCTGPVLYWFVWACQGFWNAPVVCGFLFLCPQLLVFVSLHGKVCDPARVVTLPGPILDWKYRQQCAWMEFLLSPDRLPPPICGYGPFGSCCADLRAKDAVSGQRQQYPIWINLSAFFPSTCVTSDFMIKSESHFAHLQFKFWQCVDD